MKYVITLDLDRPCWKLNTNYDCKDLAESIVNKAPSAQNNKLDKITNTMEIQQQQFTNIITAFTELIEELKKTHYR